MKIYSTTQSALTATMESCIQNDPWVRTGMALGIVGCTSHGAFQAQPSSSRTANQEPNS